MNNKPLCFSSLQITCFTAFDEVSRYIDHELLNIISVIRNCPSQDRCNFVESLEVRVLAMIDYEPIMYHIERGGSNCNLFT